ncbi:MAG TPA: hypothetical protein VG099_32215 [Gemmataceae bacterium]|nr:hypothetical protein [Gemmataceae bacterium]
MNGLIWDRLALLALCFICLLYPNVTGAEQPKGKKYETMIDSLANNN